MIIIATIDMDHISLNLRMSEDVRRVNGIQRKRKNKRRLRTD